MGPQLLILHIYMLFVAAIQGFPISDLGNGRWRTLLWAVIYPIYSNKSNAKIVAAGDSYKTGYIFYSVQLESSVPVNDGSAQKS